MKYEYPIIIVPVFAGRYNDKKNPIDPTRTVEYLLDVIMDLNLTNITLLDIDADPLKFEVEYGAGISTLKKNRKIIERELLLNCI